jgi:hypothetical protein
MPRNVNRHRPSLIKDLPAGIAVVFYRLVFGHMLNEINKHATVEEGGKYIGHVVRGTVREPGGRNTDPNAETLLISDFLPSGPRAVRTKVEFLPDGEYQERLFRQIEKVDSAIEHLGTWHTHHCNGLQELSPGDVEGYLRTVNNDRYRLNFFVASLVKRIPAEPSESDWLDHFLFLRGEDSYFDITDHVSIVDSPTRFGEYTGHIARKPTRAVGTHSRGNKTPESEDWYQTEEGHRILAEDRRFFAKQFGDQVQATRAAGRIKLTGRDRHVLLSVSYPVSPGEESLLMVLKNDDATVLEISCGLTNRRFGFAAAIAAAKEF